MERTNDSNTTIALCSLGFTNVKTYIVSAILIIGSLLLPQLFHLIPNGGVMFLPIYFFTLVGAYKYGIKVGLILSIFTPLANYAIFGMPMFPLLPMMIINSTIISIFASIVASRIKKVSFVGLLFPILAYQLATFGVDLLSSNLSNSVTLFMDSAPAILFQLFGGYLVLKLISKF